MRELLMRPLTADAVVQVALLNNQALQGTLAGIGVFPADLVQAGLLSSSAFAVERHPAADDAPADVAREFVELVTSALRKRSLGRAFDGTRRFAIQVVLDLIADARATFYDLQAAEQSASLARDAAQVAGVAADLSQGLQRAGNVDRLQVQAAQRLSVQAQLDLTAAEEVSAQTRERLNGIMGLWGDPTLWGIDSRFPDLPAAEAPPATLESLALAQHLELAAARQEIVAIVQSRGLSNLLRWVPTGSLEPREAGSQAAAASPTVELMLPVLDWKADPMPPEQAVFLTKRQRYKALAVEIHSKLRVAYTRLISARARVHLYRQMMIPLQGETLREAELRYNAMALGPLELFHIRQEEIVTNSQYIAAQRDYWVARTELQHQLGCCGDSADVSRGAAVARSETPTQSVTDTSVR